MSPQIRLVLLPALLLGLTACDEMSFGDSERFREDFRHTYPLKSGGRLIVDNFNGSVEIAGWEKDEVEINGTKYANTEDRMKEIKIEIQATADSVTVRTTRPADRRGNAGARYTIRVPHKVILENIASSNGSIRVEGVEGRGTLKSSNGSIRAYRMIGDVAATTANGTIELNEHRGHAVLRTSNGAIRGEIAKGSLDADTSNGSINVRLRESDAAKPVRTKSSNGSIELTLDAPREVHATTSNSSITLRLPEKVNASLRARTSNSSITSDFDVAVGSGKISKHSMEGPIGSGGPLLDLETTNGSIKILKQ